MPTANGTRALSELNASTSVTSCGIACLLHGVGIDKISSSHNNEAVADVRTRVVD